MKKGIVTGLIILVIAALIGFKVYSIKHPEILVSPVKTEQRAVDGVKTVETLPSGDIAASRAIIKTDIPINGTLKGVIEVGASGFNSFIVDIDKDKNWQATKKNFGKSLAWEGFANTDDIYTQTKDYIAEMAEMGVAGRNIHFVMSSGALKAKGIDKVEQAIRKKGFMVNAVTADQEGKYALKAALPKDYVNNSFVVDMGSGNTKISWYEGAALRTLETYGAKYFALDPRPIDGDVYNQIKALAAKVPSDKRQNCFIIGGIPFKLAQKVRQGEERFVTLLSPDRYSAGDDVKMLSGLNIYKAIVDGTGTSTFVFDEDANFTIGFLLSLN